MSIDTAEITNIGMGKIGVDYAPSRLTGKIGVDRAPARFRSILGSCIGLALYDPAAKAGAFAHIVLPQACRRPGPPGKFADTAVVEMLRLIKQHGAIPRRIVAKMAGGANMFGRGGPIQIGEDNVAAIKLALKTAGIRLVSQETGGQKGRRVMFDCQDGEFVVEIAGRTPKRI